MPELHLRSDCRAARRVCRRGESATTPLGRASRHAGKRFDEIQGNLASDWERAKGKSRMSWDHAKSATRAAWDRIAKPAGACLPACL